MCNQSTVEFVSAPVIRTGLLSRAPQRGWLHAGAGTSLKDATMPRVYPIFSPEDADLQNLS